VLFGTGLDDKNREQTCRAIDMRTKERHNRFVEVILDVSLQCVVILMSTFECILVEDWFIINDRRLVLFLSQIFGWDGLVTEEQPASDYCEHKMLQEGALGLDHTE
jgi:hypothetical protein